MSKRLIAGCFCCGPQSTTSLSRRGFLAGGTAIAGAVAFGGLDLISKAHAQAKPHRIDVHHHGNVQNRHAREILSADAQGLEGWNSPIARVVGLV